MQAETVVVIGCRCGFLAMAASFMESVDMHEAHVDEQEVLQSNHIGQKMAVMGPLDRDMVATLKRDAHLKGIQFNALSRVSLYQPPSQPRHVAPPRRRWNILGRLADRFFSDVGDLHYGGER